MPKRKHDEDPEDLSVPLPIQNFLWRQTSPFIRPKFGKLHEASCMEQREACKCFEKVLVQNIQFGLSPSLTQAIKSISRWRLIQAAFPHVMHCCAALLYRRKDTCLDKLGTPETKLLYTLQWIILDATEECADAEAEQGIFHPTSHYLFPISSIQVFVYLFAPLGDFLKHSDFMTSFRLENGLKLWESLWEYKHPNLPCFTTHVMSKRTFLRGRRDKQNAAKFGDVFIGAGTLSKRLSKDQCTTSVDSSDTVPTINSPASTGSENVKEESESNKSSSKEDSKKDTLFCEICSSLAVIQKDSNLLKCNCGNISIQETSGSIKAAETVEKPQSATVGEKTGKADVAMATYLDMLNTICDNEQEYSFQQRIKGKLMGHNLPTPKSHGALYIDLVSELKSLKEDLISWKIGGGKVERLISTVSTDHSTSDTSQQVGFLYQMTRRSEHSGLNDNPAEQKSETKTDIPPPTEPPKHSVPFIRGASTDSSLPPTEPEAEASTFTNIEGLSKRNPAVSEPRLWRKSTFHIKRDGNKKVGVGSGSSLTSLGTTRQVEEQESLHDSPGDQTDSVSQPPSCPTSPVGGVQSPDPDSDTHLPRHRLQRQKAPSRKTFRYRKSHRGAGWAAHTEEESGGESIAMIPTKPTTQLPLAEEDNPQAMPEVAFIQKQSRQKIASLMAGEESPVERRAKRHHGKKRFRSHSQSPTSPLSPGDAHTLDDSVESLGNGERCTLLQEGESQLEESEVSLLMISPSKDIDNTCV